MKFTVGFSLQYINVGKIPEVCNEMEKCETTAIVLHNKQSLVKD